MKYFLFLFLLILSLSFCVSANIEMNSELNLGDNGFVKISANFYEPIKLSEIDFYRRHMSTSFENVETIKIGNEQFITFKVPLNKIPDNYSINTTVKEIFMQEVQENEVSKSFKVSNKTSRFYLEESFLVVSEDYSIALQNLVGEEIQIKINPSSDEISSEGFLSSLFGGTSSTESITLGAYEKKFVNFEIGNESRLVKIEFEDTILGESQTILVYENVLESSEENSVEETNSQEENETSSSDEGSNESFGEDEEVFIETKNESTGEDETDSGINESENEEDRIMKKNTLDSYTESGILKNCSQMGGKFCNPDNETCEGVVKDAKDGVCCIGNCIEKETSSAGKWIGWVLLFFVIGSVSYALWKNKGKKGKGLELSKK
jgi:hypothetical protein